MTPNQAPEQRIRVGMFPPMDLLDRGRSATAAFSSQVEAADIDHLCCGDHVSFAGTGFDGLIQATALAMLTPELPIHSGVYQLPLRHPVPVARQLADIDRIAPGRFVLGVGVGGEDRHEVAICGVDPSTRGRQMDESLAVLRALLTGKPTSFHGDFFDVNDAVIAPPPAVPTPIVVGGRSDAAVARAGRLGDGWL